MTVASPTTRRRGRGELGAEVMAEPFDVMDVGRMSVIADPTGAALCLWEPRTHIGASLVNAPGAMTWNDLVTPDPEAAAAFYGELFGWTTEEIAGGRRLPRDPQRRAHERRDHAARPERMGADTPANWMPYFGHEDVDRLVDEIGGLGGRVFNGPIRMPQGAIAVLGDPAGRRVRGLDGRVRRLIGAAAWSSRPGTRRPATASRTIRASRCSSIAAWTASATRAGAFARHGWGGSWVDGVFDFHHFHSTSHEVLAVVAGSATLELGGPQGRAFEVAAGDVIVLPAGTGHRRARADGGFTVVGAYPAGQEDYDLLRETTRRRSRPPASGSPRSARRRRIPSAGRAWAPGADPRVGRAGRTTSM